MIHEMAAYMNRLGQLKALLTSAWFKKYISRERLAELSPIILALVPLRNKFTAHRSIDDPRHETDYQKAMHASLPFVITTRGTNKNTYNVAYDIKIAKNDRDKLLTALHSDLIEEVEIFSNQQEIWISFQPTRHHALICDEITGTIKGFFKVF